MIRILRVLTVAAALLSTSAWAQFPVRRVALTSSGTVAIDASLGWLYTLTPGEDMTITVSNPGFRPFVLLLTTSGTTSRTLTFGSGFTSVSTYATGTTSGVVCSLAFQGTGSAAREVAGSCRPLSVGAPITTVGDVESVTLSQPAAGLTISGSPCTSGACSHTFALANDLAALEGLSSTGLVTRTGDGTATTRAIAGTSNEISVSNGDGVSGAPTLSLPSFVDLGGKVLELPNATTLSSTDCDHADEAGRIAYDSDASTGSRIYACEGASGWVLQGDAGGVGVGDITDVWGATSGNVSALTAAAGDSLNATLADTTAPCKTGTALPANCTEGECFQDTNASSPEVYWCTAIDTWTALGGGGGHTLKDEGSAETARTNANFIGDGVTLADDAGNDETEIYIPGASAGAWASRPAAAAANTGGIYLSTDGTYLSRSDGSAWATFGPLDPLTPPPTSGWSWVNQSTASVTTTDGTITMRIPAAASGAIRSYVRTAPATPYVIVAAFRMAWIGQTLGGGLTFRESGTGEQHSIHFLRSATAGKINVLGTYKTDAAFAWAGNYLADVEYTPAGPLLWLRIADNGTNRIVSFCATRLAASCTTFFSVGRTDFLTADQVGISMDNVNATWEQVMTLVSWSEE